MSSNFPSLDKQLLSLASEIKNTVVKKITENADVFSNQTEADRRIKICNDCEHFTNNRCKICGCFMAAKVKLNTAKCPIKKWGYKNGEQKNFYNIKAYVLHRDNYQCQIELQKLKNCTKARLLASTCYLLAFLGC
jgi:hypothetical protein